MVLPVLCILHEKLDCFPEGHAFDMYEEVDGIACCTIVDADPVVVFDDDLTGQSIDTIVSIANMFKSVSKFFAHRLKMFLPGGADLIVLPGHDLSSNVVA